MSQILLLTEFFFLNQIVRAICFRMSRKKSVNGLVFIQITGLSFNDIYSWPKMY